MEVSTLECPGLTTARMDGNSSRQVDFAIQKMFQGYEVNLIDHILAEKEYPITIQKKSSKFLLERVVLRVEREYLRHEVKFLEVRTSDSFYYQVNIQPRKS